MIELIRLHPTGLLGGDHNPAMWLIGLIQLAATNNSTTVERLLLLTFALEYLLYAQ